MTRPRRDAPLHRDDRGHDAAGASTRGVVELSDPQRSDGAFEEIGRIDLLFSHLDKNMAGVEFPEENFVFSEGSSPCCGSGFYSDD